MKEQIESLATFICDTCRERTKCENTTTCAMADIVAKAIIKAGWCKQSEGEWIWKSNGYLKLLHCSCCGKQEEWSSAYCPNCGAHMKGADDGKAD